MKKIYYFLLIVAAFGMLLSGCGENPTDTATNTPTDNVTATPTDEPPVETPTGTETPEPEKEFTASEYIKDKALWAMPYFYKDKFLFEIQGGGDCVVRDGLGEKAVLFSVEGQERWAHAEEWGNFITSLDGIEWRNGEILNTHFGGDESPKTREEAVQKIYDFLDTYKDISSTGVYYSMNSIFPWQHYAGEAGFHVLGAEFAESYNYQLRLAMTRGAAKQYKTPWFVDFSLWYGGVLDYRDPSPYGKNPDGTSTGGPNNGQSISMFERSILMSYMAGTNAVVAEAGGGTCYYNYDNGKTIKITDKNDPAYGGFFYVAEGENITPYGEACKKFYDFTKEYSDVGTAYTPYAVILDKYHGMSGYQSETSMAFDRFEYEDGDIFTLNVIQSIWPTWDKPNQGSQQQLVNGKYGESFDFLMQNVSADLLDTYKALVLTGNLELSGEEVQKYMDYVKKGGCLVVNTAYVDQFTDVELPAKMELGKYYAEVSYGEGSFVVFGKGGMLENCINFEGKTVMQAGSDYGISGFAHVMELLESKFNIIKLSEDVDYVVSIKDDNTVYVTLINNAGVVKHGYEAVVFDDTKKVDIEVEFIQNYAVESVTDVYNSTSVEYNNGTASLTLGPGGIAVLEFKMK